MLLKNNALINQPLTYEILNAEATSVIYFNEEKDNRSPEPVDVFIEGNTPYSDIEPYLEQLQLICINLPAFADGRAYSLAQQIKRNPMFRGTLRACGEVLADQALYLQKVGFDELEFESEQHAHSALNTIKAFSVSYQSTTNG